MQVINNNELFTQVAAEESSIASGGAVFPNLFNYGVFSLQSIQLASPGGTTYTDGEAALGVIVLSVSAP